MAIKVNSIAPDFVLKDQNGEPVQLSTLRGRKVLLSFRPLAWTPICTDQMRSLDVNHKRLDELNTSALGVGVDSVPSNKAWADSMAITQTRILSDFWPHGEVAKLYDVFRERDGALGAQPGQGLQSFACSTRHDDCEYPVH